MNIIPQSGGRGGKIAVGDSKQQLDNTNTNYKINKNLFKNKEIQIWKLRKKYLKIKKYKFEKKKYKFEEQNLIWI